MINAIVLRNIIANKIKNFENVEYENNNFFPEVQNFESNNCKKCFKSSICKAHYYLFENVNNDIFPKEMKYYFQEFYRIINKEENFLIKNKRKYVIENKEDNLFKCVNVTEKEISFQITLNKLTSNFFHQRRLKKNIIFILKILKSMLGE